MTACASCGKEERRFWCPKCRCFLCRDRSCWAWHLGTCDIESVTDLQDREAPERGGEEYRPVTLDAHETVMQNRQALYGSPRPEFEKLARIWSALVGAEITVRQVVLMMVTLKVVRAAHGYHRDNLVDIAGYAECLNLVEDEMAREGQGDTQSV